MKAKGKRLLSVLLTLCIVATLVPAMSMSAHATIDYGTGDWSNGYGWWSQDQSVYSDMRDWGCYLTAKAKMLVQAGIADSNPANFNPDVYYKWENSCGYTDSDMYSKTYYAPQYYADSVGKKMTYEGVTYENNTDKVWENIRAGKYTILRYYHPTYGSHYVFVNNGASIETGRIRVFQSGYSFRKGVGSGTQDLSYTISEILTYSADKASTASATIREGVYLLRSALDNDLVIGIQNESTNWNANVELQKYSGSSSQLFRIIRFNDCYTIVDVNSQLSLDVTNESDAAGTNIQQYYYWPEQTKAQQWYFEDAGNGYYYVRSAVGTYVDVLGGVAANGQNVQMYSFNGTDAQKWKLEDAPTAAMAEGNYFLRSALDNDLVIGIQNESTDWNANVELQKYSGSSSQLFKIRRFNDCYTIVDVNSQLSLDVTNESDAAGTNIQQYYYWPEQTKAQQWYFEDAGNGYYYIRSALGTYVDVLGGVAANGQNVQMYPFNGTDAQKWKLEDAPTIVSQRYQGSDWNEGWYEGEWSNDKPNGYGKLTYDDFDDGKFYTLDIDGTSYKALSYEGYFEDGWRAGNGVVIYEGGYREEGVFYGRWSAGKTVFEGKRWKTTDDSEGYWPLTMVAISSADSDDQLGDWVYTKEPKPSATDVVSVKLDAASLSLKKGDSAVLIVTVSPESAADKDVTWTSSNSDVAKVNSNGKVTGVASGTATITAAAGGKSASCTVTVSEKTAATELPKQASNVHFERVTIYFQDQFTDVPSDQWYTGSVADAFELGLMKGNSRDTFNPYGDVTIAEAVTMAARIHSIYSTGTENFDQSTGGAWYQSYLDYALENGIISRAYYNCDVSHKATRAQFAEIFAKSLPAEGLLAINDISDGVIPDVSSGESYAEYVYLLYRAGILTGSDSNGTFNPQTYITRAESAAIVSRMAESSNRVLFYLG